MIQELQDLLEAYAICDDHRRKRSPENWEPQQVIHFEILSQFNYAIVRRGTADNPKFYLQPRNSPVVTYDTAEYKTR